MYPCLPRAGGFPKGRAFPSLTAARDSILKEMDRELTKGALSTEGFGKYFWDNCRDEALAETVREILK